MASYLPRSPCEDGPGNVPEPASVMIRDDELFADLDFLKRLNCLLVGGNL